MKTDIKKLENSKIEINVEIDSVDFEKSVQEKIQGFQRTTTIQGFRKGKAPESMVIQNAGEMNILNKAAEDIINESYRKIIKDNNIEPLGSPEINIIKIARKNPFIFKVTASLFPEIKLYDYDGDNLPRIEKKLDEDVNEKEIEQSLDYIKKSQVKLFEKESNLAEKGDFVEIEYSSIIDNKRNEDKFILGQGGQGQISPFEKDIIGMKREEAKVVEVNQREKDKEPLKFNLILKNIKRVEFPEINDEFVRSLGTRAKRGVIDEALASSPNFQNLEDFKINIKKGIKAEKKAAEKQRVCLEFLEKISKKIEIDIPEILIKSEQDKILDNLKKNIEREVPFEEYLKKTNKTEEEVLKSFEEQAKTRVTNFLILRKIAEKQKIKATEDEIKKKAKEIIQYYGLEEKDVDQNQIEKYAEEQIITQKTFDYIYSLYYFDKQEVEVKNF